MYKSQGTRWESPECDDKACNAAAVSRNNELPPWWVIGDRPGRISSFRRPTPATWPDHVVISSRTFFVGDHGTHHAGRPLSEHSTPPDHVVGARGVHAGEISDLSGLFDARFGHLWVRRDGPIPTGGGRFDDGRPLEPGVLNLMSW